MTDFDKLRADLGALLAARSATMESVRVPARPDGDATWNKGALHYHCTITAKTLRAPFTLTYSVGAGVPLSDARRTPRPDWAKGHAVTMALRALPAGVGISGRRTLEQAEAEKVLHNAFRPNLVDVVQPLLCDAEGVDARTFDEWAGDYGYDTDSRRALEIYLHCQEIARVMRQLFGADLDAAHALAREF